jgi:menaquinone-specific isochorismate synthase
VAGTPTDRAVSLIREIETSPRGAYGGPVGWFDREGNGVFAVAIRSAQFGDGLVLHAGGGLVAGSVEADELEETELKLRTVLDAFQS